MNVLIVKPSSFGDVLHTFPAVDLLRRTLPEARITWVVNEELADLVELCPAVERVILFPRQKLRQARNWPRLAGFLADLRELEFEYALDFQGLMRSGLITWAARARHRVGFRSAREGARTLYTERVPLPANLRHAVDKNVFLVRSTFGTELPHGFPDLVVEPQAQRRGQRLLEETGLASAGPLVAVAPGSRWESKTWPPGFFARVMDRVAELAPQTGFWLLGTQSEHATGETVIRACSSARPVNLMGRTPIPTLAHLVAGSSALLCNDSGPMHLAAAVRTSVVALFGPTDPELTGPYGDGHITLRATCEDAPCFRRQCPRQAHAACHGRISEEETAQAVLQLLSEGTQARPTPDSSSEPRNDQ